MPKPRVTILYAYGASNQEGVNVKNAALKHLKSLDLEFETIHWRPHLPPPSDLDLRSVADRAPSNSNQSALVRSTASPLDIVLSAIQWPINLVIRRMNYGILRGSGTTIGDVLRYIDDPGPVRGHVQAVFEESAERAKKDGRTVIALGLSLGGIILADVLRDKRTTKPAALGLITIGSQYGALKRFGVVDLNTRQEPLFSPWVNIWHKNDLLSFPAGVTFSSGIGTIGDDEVIDIRSQRRGIFPKVHSGYLLEGSADWTLIERAITKHLLPAVEAKRSP